MFSENSSVVLRYIPTSGKKILDVSKDRAAAFIIWIKWSKKNEWLNACKLFALKGVVFISYSGVMKTLLFCHKTLSWYFYSDPVSESLHAKSWIFIFLTINMFSHVTPSQIALKYSSPIKKGAKSAIHTKIFLVPCIVYLSVSSFFHKARHFSLF